MFDSAVPKLILDSIRELEASSRTVYERQLDEHEDFYLGGSGLVKYLHKHVKETDKEFATRRDRFQSFNYAGRIADEIINSLYGPRVERSIAGVSETDGLHEMFESIWFFNSYDRKMLDAASLFVPLGSCYVRPWWDEAASGGSGQLRYAVLKPQDVLAIPRGDDAERLLGLIERREEKLLVGGRLVDRKRYFIWTAEQYGELEVSADGGAAWMKDGEWQDNQYGVIPHVQFRGRSMAGLYEGQSLIADAVTIQKELNNRSSVQSILILMQGFSQLVVAGDAPSELEVSETGFIKVGKDGKVYYLQPGAPITEIETSMDKLVERMCDCSGVPVSAVRGGTASSGVQLAIEMKPLADIVQRLKTQCIESEQELFENTLHVLEAHGARVSQEATLNVDFPETFLPTDRQAEAMNDLALVQANLMSRKQFLKARNPDLTDEDIERMLEEIDGDVAKGREARTAIARPGFPPSLLGVGAEEEAE